MYVYDLSNQLIRVLSGSNVVGEYTFNGAGQRIKKVTQTETRIFHYDLLGHLIAETNQSGQMLAEYIYLGDQLLAMIRPGEVTYYFHNNHLGTPQILTNESQTIAWKAVYRPFGGADVLIQTVENPFRFPGQYYDQETGLHYNYYRYYDPTTGRYVTPDPIGLEGGINLFAYVRNNPVNYVDPFGLTLGSNVNFFWDWISGGGQTNRTYGPNNIETQEMQNSIGVNQLRERFYKSGCKSTARGEYGTYEAYFDYYINPLTLDPTSTAFQVGGYAGARVINNGNGTVTFTITNVAGTHSFFLHAVPDRKSTTGPMRNINQIFQWTEPIDQSRCGCKK